MIYKLITSSSQVYIFKALAFVVVVVVVVVVVFISCLSFCDHPGVSSL